MRLSLEKKIQKCNGKSYHGRGQKFCDFILVILTLTVNWMLPQDHYNLDIRVMSSPSMVQVPYCWLNQTHEQSNRSVCNRYWRAAPEIGKRIRILASSIRMRFKVCQGMTLLMDEWSWCSEQTNCPHLQHCSSSITIFSAMSRTAHPVTQHHIPQDLNPLQHHRENHISRSIVLSKVVYNCLSTTP